MYSSLINCEEILEDPCEDHSAKQAVLFKDKSKKKKATETEEP